MLISKQILLKYTALEKLNIGKKTDFFIVTGHSEPKFGIQYSEIVGLDILSLYNQRMVMAKLEVTNERKQTRHTSLNSSKTIQPLQNTIFPL